MALLNKDNKYIKVYSNGNYEIYPSVSDRNKFKYATPYSIIFSKYDEIIQSLQRDLERQYYDSIEWEKEFSGWYNEFQKYQYEYMLKKGGSDYPLMSTFYPDVSDSIPNMQETGCICIAKETSEEIYETAKKNKYWGETEDC